MTVPTAAQRVSLDWGVLYWLVAVEAAMRVHRRVYPGDRHWRRWIRAQALDDQWFDRLVRQAGAILDGRAARFIDPNEAQALSRGAAPPEPPRADTESLGGA